MFSKCRDGKIRVLKVSIENGMCMLFHTFLLLVSYLIYNILDAFVIFYLSFVSIVVKVLIVVMV